MKTDIGEIKIVQIVGMIARRCIVYHSIGDELNQGEKLGMIYYGSEVDIHFPVECGKIVVRKGQKTAAGITQLVQLNQ